ncbi:MAG: hypothetical protein H6863_05365 [Rhodospirillales bacterium]|nr:hypothetical protein [Rhodospirillales bacterium]MCB9980545.1 hypothetical protein [Rhodospirillales bacterium]
MSKVSLNIEHVSKKKVLVIVLCAAFAILCALYAELYAKPGLVKSEKTLKSTTKELNETKANNLKIEDELIYMREKREDFRSLELAGFFTKQQRDVIQKTVDEAMRVSGIMGGGFRVSPPSCFVNADLKDSNYVLIGSPVVVNVDAYEDLSVYKFLDLFVRTLPGYVVLEDLQVRRMRNVTRTLLQEIGTGQKIPVMSSGIKLTWYTVVNKDSIECAGTER